MTSPSWHIEPRAAWMKPKVFALNGPAMTHTADLLRLHGPRCVRLWRESVLAFAGGAPITTSVIERHNRQSFEHWCLGRAAGFALADACLAGTRAGQSRGRGAPVAHDRSGRGLGIASVASPAGRTMAEARRKLFRGGR